jgi:flagellar biosynthesis GTPase FlhF
VIKETDNPFGDDDEEDKPSPAGPSKTHSRNSSLNPPVTGVIQSFSYDAKEKKKKEKKQKKHKPFNIETEKEQMKAHIAEASISATNLMNTLKTINREKERISENQIAVQHFEMCKQLRRKILRYVSGMVGLIERTRH